MAGRPVVISILADTKKASSALSQLANDTGFSRVGSKFVSLGKTVAKGLAAATVAFGAFAVKSVKAASDLQQATGAVEAVFKDMASGVISTSKKAASQYGISAAEFQNSSAMLGALLLNQGVSQDKLAGSTENLIGMAADLSSMYGGTTSRAIEAMTSALKGNFNMLDEYGISISAATVSAKMSAEGLTKAEAVMALIAEQGGIASGNFAKEANTWGGQVQRLQAKFIDLSAAFGTYLLPALTAAVSWFSNLVPSMDQIQSFMDKKIVPAVKRAADAFRQDILPVLKQVAEELTSRTIQSFRQLSDWFVNTGGPAIQDFGKWLKEHQTVLIVAASAVAGMVTALKAMSVIQSVTTWIQATKAAVIAFNAALAANPIGLVVAAIGALVGALVWFFTSTETGKAIWENVWGFITETTGAFFSWFSDTLVPIFQTAWEAITSAVQVFADWFGANVVPVIQAGGELIAAIFERIGQAWEAVWAILEPLFNGLLELWDMVWAGIQTAWTVYGPPLIAMITGAFETMKGVLDGIWNAIKTIVETALGVIKGIINTVTSVIKGDWSGAWNAIKTTVSTVWDGIKSVVSTAINTVKTTVSNVLNTIKTTFSTSWNQIKTTVQTIWNQITSIWSNAVGSVRSTFNSIGEAIKSPLSAAFNAIKNLWNSTIGKLSFTVPDWVPGIGGKGWSAPKLARGGIATRATMAMIGEGREPEAVLPLSRLRALLKMSSIQANTSGYSRANITNKVTNNYTAEVHVDQLQEIKDLEELFNNTSYELRTI